MPQNTTQESTSLIIPYLCYEDVAAALDWLAVAFGFREHLRHPGPNGRIDHAEMRIGHSAIMLGGPGPDYRNPKRRARVRKYVEVVVYVDDVDEHFRRAKAAGAAIISEPKDEPYGIRGYRAEDLEGHVWDFAQQIRDVAPEEWGAITA
jgi:uncharacterized glyoxalase superfamily protein PhnB